MSAVNLFNHCFCGEKMSLRVLDNTSGITVCLSYGRENSICTMNAYMLNSVYYYSQAIRVLTSSVTQQMYM